MHLMYCILQCVKFVNSAIYKFYTIHLKIDYVVCTTLLILRFKTLKVYICTLEHFLVPKLIEI